LRILFVCDYYPPHVGGAELVYRRYCEGLAKCGHSVRVVTIKHSNEVPHKELVNGVWIYRIKTPLNSRYLFSFWSFPKVIKYAKEADLVHCGFFVAPFSAIPAARLMGKPLVVTVHEIWGNLWFNFESNPFRAIINYFGEKLLTAISYEGIICPSKYTLKSLVRFGVKKELITYIPNGVETDLFRPRPRDSKLNRKLGLEGFKVYMFYGRPGISKGIEYLIKAAVLIKKEMINSRLLLILGREPIREYNRILHLIDELELKDHIRLLDPVPYTELPKYVSLADLVVVPSLSEGFGFTAAESAAMGKPVVGTYSGSLPEIINHGKTGLLVKPRSPDEIYEAICRLLNNEKDLQGMGKNAQKNVSKLNWETTINSLEALYVQLLT